MFLEKCHIFSFVICCFKSFSPRFFLNPTPYRESSLQTEGDNPPVPIVLQGAGADIQPLAYFLTCEKVLTAKQQLVYLCHFLNSLAYSADSLTAPPAYRQPPYSNLLRVP